MRGLQAAPHALPLAQVAGRTGAAKDNSRLLSLAAASAAAVCHALVSCPDSRLCLGAGRNDA
ncbi:MAG TPA: hypothetical protein PLB41_01200, partial [Rubrivivax sp.]|nr:hypothetical protein [Rubrivivax sp.]